MYAGENEMLVTDSLNRIDQILQLQPLPVPEQTKEPQDNSITLEHIAFAYAGKEKRAVDDVSLEIKGGQHVALVGPSGGGKSTIASLVARFWDVQEGAVRIDGVDVREIDPKKLMDTVSFVFQNSRLFKMSILENVRLARPEATREEVLQALHDAQCDDILEKLPQGVDTVIGAKGVYVSGGEQQRISIARVFLKDAPIILLDEATASLDVDNETLIQSSLSKLIQNKTVLIIAHRMRTVANADQIVVLKEGRIAEHGSPKELIEKDGIFVAMSRLQTEGQKWTMA